jgi:hypothetical protein
LRPNNLSASGSSGVPECGLGRFYLANAARAVTLVENLAINMFSHVVIFWTDPKQTSAADELIAGANQYLKPIPGALQFHVGKMVPSHRPVVDQSYQVALNILFPDKKTQDDYQVHPMHVEFIEKVFKRVCTKVTVYDFA